MEPVKLEKIIQWVNGKPQGAPKDAIEDIIIKGISTDTRTIKKGELFIPLAGENFDGHDYISLALEKGAGSFLTSKKPSKKLKKGVVAIAVQDTLAAYQELARNYLDQFKIPVVAITGSNGKTTTKDITAHVLGKKFSVLATEKNFNNEVGVPQTIMKLDSSKDALLIEMAMRGVGQIKALACIAPPDVAVITNIGESHFELLGSYEAIANAKCEILEKLNPRGFAVLNSDDRWFSFCAEQSPARIVTFGINKPADVRLIRSEDLGLEGYNLHVALEGEVHNFRLPLLGVHNIYNALAAIAVGLCLRMRIDEIRAGLETVIPSEKRMEVLSAPGGWTILNDTYNASPSSTRSALEILASLQAKGRKIAVLGDMLELGEIADESHKSIGAYARESGVKILYTLGELGREIAEGAGFGGVNNGSIKHWEKKSELCNDLKGRLGPGDLVLVKGSRRMKMEEISQALVS